MKKYIVVRVTGSWLVCKNKMVLDTWYWTKTLYRATKFDSAMEADTARSICDQHFKFLPGTTAVMEYGK